MGKYRKMKERLDGLERRARDHDDQLRRGGDRRGRDDRGERDGHRGHDGHRGRDGHDGGGHDEKRIIDTIVRLVSERVGEMMGVDDHSGHDHHHDGCGERDGRDDWGDEKRKIDFIVDLVSERVQLIVAAELDRRLGSAAEEAAGDGESGPRTGGKRRDPEAR